MPTVEVRYTVHATSKVEIAKAADEIDDDDVLTALWDQTTILVGQDLGDVDGWEVVGGDG